MGSPPLFDRHTTHCRHCERDVETVARKGQRVEWIRCRECGTPIPTNGGGEPA